MNKEKLEAEARKVDWAVSLAHQNGDIDRSLSCDIYYLIDCITELDEPEVLSQDWIDEYVVEGDFRGEQQFWYGRFIEEEKVKNLLVPKREKPVIPQFVADWIEIEKAGYIDKYVILERFMCGYNAVELPNDLYNYYDNNKGNSRDKVINAILYGYDVEEQKKYYVDLDTAAYVAKWNGDNQVGIYTDGISGSDEFEFHLTEKEIKDYDKRFWAFAEEVTE